MVVNSIKGGCVEQKKSYSIRTQTIGKGHYLLILKFIRLECQQEWSYSVINENYAETRI